MKWICFRLLLVFAFAASAQAQEPQDQALEYLQKGEVQSLQELIADAKHRYPSELIAVDVVQSERGWMYDIKMLAESGQILILRYLAATGELLKTDGKSPSMFEDMDMTGENDANPGR